MLAQFRAHGVVLERLMSLTPELKSRIEHAAQAQRAHVENARNTLSVGGVDFAIRRDGEPR